MRYGIAVFHRYDEHHHGRDEGKKGVDFKAYINVPKLFLLLRIES